MPIRTCLFDMGNVLVHFSHERMCEQIGEECDLSGTQVRELLFDTGLQADFERGLHTEEEMHRRLERVAGRPIDFDRLRLAGCDIFHLNEPMLPLLDRLRALGVRLVLFSNTSVSHFDFVRSRFDLFERFDDMVVSYQVGAIKPEPAMYETGLQKINCDPHECFYTDDVPEYVAAARKLGFQAEVFVDPPTLVEQLKQRGIEIDGGDDP